MGRGQQNNNNNNNTGPTGTGGSEKLKSSNDDDTQGWKLRRPTTYLQQRAFDVERLITHG